MVLKPLLVLLLLGYCPSAVSPLTPRPPTTETIMINFIIRKEVRHDRRRPDFKVAFLVFVFFFLGFDGEALPAADECNSRIMSHFRF